MGGLIEGSTVKGDLWMVESSGGNLSCLPISTVSEGPGPRVGHASLLVGNAFIVFGGDTKVDDHDTLDETLYLLNTCEFAPDRFGDRLLIAANSKRLGSGPVLFLLVLDRRGDTDIL